MNFATIPNVPLLLKGRGKGKTFDDIPINLGLQPIKLLPFEPFEVETPALLQCHRTASPRILWE